MAMTLFDYLTVNGTDGPIGWITQVPYTHAVKNGSHFCLNFTSFLSWTSGVRISAISEFGNEIGCVDIVLQDNRKERFLAF